MSNKKPFEIPKPVLRQINDCANGGFILFAFNENNMPSVSSHFKDPAKALALQQYINNWVLAVEAINLEVTVDIMKEELEIDDSEEEISEEGEDPEDSEEDEE
tara:strand:- start:20561 stop:20869 length:309 start_codon:yes stop_codon:yes gene_type:complete